MGMDDRRSFENVPAVAALSTPFRYPKKSRFLRLRTRYRLRPLELRAILISSSILWTAGCATIAPRNVLPEAIAGQIELEGFYNIRFWGDASARDIQAIAMADGTKAETRLALGGERHQPISNLLAISGGAHDGDFGAGLLVGRHNYCWEKAPPGMELRNSGAQLNFRAAHTFAHA